MKKVIISFLLCIGFVAGFVINSSAQSDIDYANPKDYEVGGVRVTGNKFTDSGALISISGLKVGGKVKIPGDDIPKAIKKLWKLRLFTDIQIKIENKINFFQTFMEKDSLDVFVQKGISTKKLDKGCIIMNPPYGERLGDLDELKVLYKQLGDHLKQNWKGWRAFILIGDLELVKHVGLRTKRKHIVFNGPIECRWCEYELF